MFESWHVGTNEPRSESEEPHHSKKYATKWKSIIQNFMQRAPIVTGFIARLTACWDMLKLSQTSCFKFASDPAILVDYVDIDTRYSRWMAWRLWQTSRDTLTWQLSPHFFIHYSPQTLNKNLIYYMDNHRRPYPICWGYLTACRDKIARYNCSVDGFDHTAWPGHNELVLAEVDNVIFVEGTRVARHELGPCVLQTYRAFKVDLVKVHATAIPRRCRGEELDEGVPA
ncbi:hypothetical protein BJV78DRAFT_1151942 [Lactifluus subvellereus]|nr:hypothetical protein BJV78DRAFT_1151942 [Lactifluus subvellereus]